MSDPKELFPFPVVDSGDSNTPAGDPKTPSAALPGFPETVNVPASANADSLTPEEVKDLRRLLQEYRLGKLTSASPKSDPPIVPLPLPVMPTIGQEMKPLLSPPVAGTVAVSAAAPTVAEQVLEQVRALDLTIPVEIEMRNELVAALGEINEASTLLGVWSAVAGVFPLRGCLRHGTPEQRLFTLIALGDRFCESLAGMRWPGRQALIKGVARYLSDVSEVCSFLSMEQEPFQPTYHERVLGSSAGNSLIREMRGFLVIRRQNQQVIRLGRVWT